MDDEEREDYTWKDVKPVKAGMSKKEKREAVRRAIAVTNLFEAIGIIHWIGGRWEKVAKRLWEMYWEEEIIISPTLLEEKKAHGFATLGGTIYINEGDLAPSTEKEPLDPRDPYDFITLAQIACLLVHEYTHTGQSWFTSRKTREREAYAVELSFLGDVLRFIGSLYLKDRLTTMEFLTIRYHVLRHMETLVSIAQEKYGYDPNDKILEAVSKRRKKTFSDWVEWNRLIKSIESLKKQVEQKRHQGK